MQNKIRFILFTVLAVLLMTIVIRPALHNQLTLTAGTLHKFDMRPVDPEDPFRGRYVALDFAQRSAPIRSDEDSLILPRKLFAVLTVDSIGFTQVDHLQREKPSDGEYVTVNVSRRNLRKKLPSSSKVNFDFPFIRFYMTEKLAPVAERIYRREVRQGERDSGNHLAVRILNGHAVIEELYLKGVPISEASKDELNK